MLTLHSPECPDLAASGKVWPQDTLELGWQCIHGAEAMLPFTVSSHLATFSHHGHEGAESWSATSPYPPESSFTYRNSSTQNPYVCVFWLVFTLPALHSNTQHLDFNPHNHQQQPHSLGCECCVSLLQCPSDCRV